MNKILVSFDCTGSMFPAIVEVKRRLNESLSYLFTSVPDLQIGVVAHGDYCDRDFYRYLPFTNGIKMLSLFINNQTADGGGDAPECYEYVLQQAADIMGWNIEDNNAIIMIGDEVPHERGYVYRGTRGSGYSNNTNWKEEVAKLAKLGVKVYGVQALRNSYASTFYEFISHLTGGTKINLHQLNNVVELIEAVAHKQNNSLDNYEQFLIVNFRMNRVVGNLIDTLRGTKSTVVSYKDVDLEVVHPGRFQLLHVDRRVPIKVFVNETGATFKVGRGFYQFTKTEEIQPTKEVVLRDKESGDMWTGNKARDMIGIPYGERDTLKPVYLRDYDIFVQSTSSNRVLMPDTMFLYEV